MAINKYLRYLENLRRSGITNMFGAAPYLANEFGLSSQEARKILSDWMHNYNPDDYEEDDYSDEEEYMNEDYDEQYDF